MHPIQDLLWSTVTASHADVVVLGGGAAGLMCAIVAGKRGRHVIVLEGSNRVGKKILMSGGGRCNFTNLHCDPSCFISRNSRFCVSALSRYTQWDFIAMVEKHNIAYHEKMAGQLFCDHSSKEIVTMLLDECESAGVQIETQCDIESIRHDGRFRLSSNRGDFDAESLVVATGGLSIPKMGATGLGYEIARQFGHTVLDTTAALVPLTFTGATHEMTGRLAGVSINATVATSSGSFRGDILFTHRGLSGPAILQLSSFWSPGQDIHIDLLPEEEATGFLLRAKKSQPKSLLRTALGELLPRALVGELQELFFPELADTPMAEISADALQKIGQQLSDWTLKPAGTEGYRTAEVTLGGVDTRELSSKTMESSLQPGLFFVGEVVDVTGQLGGFNFQWAWSSGHAAGEVV